MTHTQREYITVTPADFLNYVRFFRMKNVTIVICTCDCDIRGHVSYVFVHIKRKPFILYAGNEGCNWRI